MQAAQITKAFYRDIEEIAEKAIEAFGLSYDKTASSNLHDPLLRWCDFTLRYIPPATRRIFKSDRFPVNISESANVGLQRIENLFLNGGDVNPYQSKTLTLFNDTSGKKAKKRTDGLWADWDIHHLHLPLEPADPAKKYSNRSEWVLFLMVFYDAVLFIDIKHHDNNIETNLFSQQDFVRTIVRNWPEVAERSQIRGVAGLAIDEPITDADVGNLRSHGIVFPVEIDGKVYFPFGMGVTTAVTSTRVSTFRDRIYHYVRQIVEALLDESNQFMRELRALSVDDPEFHVMLLEEGCLGIYEKKAHRAWRLGRVNPERPNDLFCSFNNALMPDWAGRVISSYGANHS